MSANNWSPWWQQVGNKSANEREEFVRGVFGKPAKSNSENILLALIAGYVGGRIAKRTGNDK